jgi:hypothetical protein
MAILAMNITGRMPVPRVVEAEYEKGITCNSPVGSPEKNPGLNQRGNG